MPTENPPRIFFADPLEDESLPVSMQQMTLGEQFMRFEDYRTMPHATLRERGLLIDGGKNASHRTSKD